jgi:hypothetical protein
MLPNEQMPLLGCPVVVGSIDEGLGLSLWI